MIKTKILESTGDFCNTEIWIEQEKLDMDEIVSTQREFRRAIRKEAPTEEQLKQLRRLYKASIVLVDFFLAGAGVKDVPSLSKKEVSRLLEKLKGE